MNVLGYFLGENTYDEPVEFEIAHNNDKLPALRGTDKVLTTNANHDGLKKEDAKGKKARIGIHDIITNTYLQINSPFLLNILRSFVEHIVVERKWL